MLKSALRVHDLGPSETDSGPPEIPQKPREQTRMNAREHAQGSLKSSHFSEIRRAHNGLALPGLTWRDVRLEFRYAQQSGRPPTTLGTGSSPKCPTGKSLLVFRNRVKARFAKIFLFFSDPNQFTDSPRPVSTRGALRTSPTRGGMRWTRAARETNAVCLRTAKSCGSDAPIVGVKPVRRSAGDGVKKRGHRGEREVSRKTIARGMPG